MGSGDRPGGRWAGGQADRAYGLGHEAQAAIGKGEGSADLLAEMTVYTMDPRGGSRDGAAGGRPRGGSRDELRAGAGTELPASVTQCGVVPLQLLLPAGALGVPGATPFLLAAL